MRSRTWRTKSQDNATGAPCPHEPPLIPAALPGGVFRVCMAMVGGVPEDMLNMLRGEG